MTEKLVVTGSQLISAIRALAKARPLFVYGEDFSRCVYYDNVRGCGACIVGAALLECGVSLEDLQKMDLLGSPLGSPSFSALFRARSENGFKEDLGFDLDCTPEEIAWVVDVQENQDVDMTWSHAVTNADLYAPLPGEK